MRKVHRLIWMALLLAVSCSVKISPLGSELKSYRGALKPNPSFKIYALKYPSLSPVDQIAVSYTDVTEMCHFASFGEGDSQKDLSFVCSENSDSYPAQVTSKPLSGHKSYLWLGHNRRLTHLWVNRVLYTCNIEKNKDAISCETASSVRNLTSQTN